MVNLSIRKVSGPDRQVLPKIQKEKKKNKLIVDKCFQIILKEEKRTPSFMQLAIPFFLRPDGVVQERQITGKF